jgi:hypothetical protein
VLALAQHDRRDAHLAGPAQHLAEEGVGLAVLVERLHVVGLLVVDGLDVRCVDEADELDGPPGLDVGLLEVLLREDDVAILLVLVAADDLLPRHFLAGVLVDSPVADGREFAAVEEVESKLARILGRSKGDGNLEQAEAQGAFPDGPCHGRPRWCSSRALPPAMGRKGRSGWRGGVYLEVGRWSAPMNGASPPGSDRASRLTRIIHEDVTRSQRIALETRSCLGGARRVGC